MTLSNKILKDPGYIDSFEGIMVRDVKEFIKDLDNYCDTLRDLNDGRSEAGAIQEQILRIQSKIKELSGDVLLGEGVKDE